jgi:hypothetical protein
MILRYGFAHAFAILAPIAALLAILIPLVWLAGRISKRAAESPVVEKVASGLGALCCFVFPFVLFFSGTTVWVIDDGENGQLAWRRYLLYGPGSSVDRLNGQGIAFRAGPGLSDIVVNASTGQIQVEEVAYGVASTQLQLKRILIEPGEARSVQIVEAVGSPPSSIELGGRSRSTVKAYVHK